MISSEGLKREKRRMRSGMRQMRDGIPAQERGRLGHEIERRLLEEVPGVTKARTAMCFASYGSEVPTDGIIRRLDAAGCVVALPRVQGRVMEAVSFRPGDPVVTAAFGAEEPWVGIAVPPEVVDLVIVPGLAFDREGYRIGYGGGYYDRFLRQARNDALLVGICFGAQVVDAVPHGSADLPVRWIATELEVIRCSVQA